MEFIEKKVHFTNRKGYVQIFADHEANRWIEEWNKDAIFLFLDYLRKKKKVNYKKVEIKKMYDEFMHS